MIDIPPVQCLFNDSAFTGVRDPAFTATS